MTSLSSLTWVWSPIDRMYYTGTADGSACACAYEDGTWSADAATSLPDGELIWLVEEGFPDEGAAKAQALVLLDRVRAERDRAPRTRFQIIEEM